MLVDISTTGVHIYTTMWVTKSPSVL